MVSTSWTYDLIVQSPANFLALNVVVLNVVASKLCIFGSHGSLCYLMNAHCYVQHHLPHSLVESWAMSSWW